MSRERALSLRAAYLARARGWSQQAIRAANTGDCGGFVAAQRRAWGLERAAGAMDARLYFRNEANRHVKPKCGLISSQFRLVEGQTIDEEESPDVQ